MYDTSSNALRQAWPSSLLGGFGGWVYDSLDDKSVVQVAGYLTDAGKRGLKRGDIVIVRCTATGEVSTHSVLFLMPSANNWDLTPGAASLSQVNGPALSVVLTAGANPDVIPTDQPMSAYGILGFSPSSGAATVSGLLAGVAGQVLVASNDDAVNSVTLLGLNSATLANRFSTAIVIPAGGVQLLVYLASLNLWTPLSPV
jgi:hypothetical protein